MVHHEHVASEYNARRRDCERGVELLKPVLPGIRALRDVSPAELERHAGRLPEVVYRRCRHVITENDRTERAAAALDEGDLELAGRLMAESHKSMRDDFEITVPEVDRMVELNRRRPGRLRCAHDRRRFRRLHDQPGRDRCGRAVQGGG